MDKYQKKEMETAIWFLIGLVGMIISFIIVNYYITIVFILYILFIWSFYEIQHRRNPYKLDPDDIRELKEKLEKEDIKDFIKDKFTNKGMNVSKISRKLDKEFDIELLVPRGPTFRHFKSDELYEKMIEILGFKTEEEYGRALRKKFFKNS